jgi:hypothetical protein
MKDIISLHLEEPRYDIADGVISDVTHMQFAGWIGKHFQNIIFFLFRLFRRTEKILLFPCVLPPGFDVPEIVLFFHGRPFQRDRLG